MIGFLIRTTFWFSLVLLLLPFGGDGSSDELGPIQALLAAREAVQDISGICERKPDVCKAGNSALHTIGVKAKATAQLAYEMLDDKGEEAVVTQAPDAISTGTVTVAPVVPAESRPDAPK